ncbi:MAG: LysR substrate-binding domain-containing protein [Bacteroidota bacterium]
MTSISISQIQYTLALERTGSFSKAAEVCFVTQSTLSTMIKRLENQIGLTLFDRKAKPICITSEGKALIEQFKIIYHEYENLTELIQTTKKDLSGTLKIGVIPTLAPFLLPLFLDRLVVNYPNIHFTIHEITTDSIIKALKVRELDVGILSIPVEQDAGLEQKSLFKEEFLVYDASEIRKNRPKYSVSDIDLSRLWLLEESHCLTNQIGKICHLKNKQALQRNLLYKSGSILSLLQLVNSNKGLTLLPKLASLNEKIVDKEFLFPLELPRPAREIGMLTHPNLAKKRLIKILEKEIIEAVHPLLRQSIKVEIISPI